MSENPTNNANADRTSDRITITPGVCGGRPCVRGMRIRVTDVLEMLAGGASHEEILRDYLYLEREDITACVCFSEGEK